MKKFLMLCLLFLFAGCASAPVQPDWIAGNSGKYDASRYLIGRGQADISALARDRARSDLAKIFQVAVSEESREFLKQSSEIGDESSTAQFESKITRNIVTRTDQIVQGVQIVETWQDPETKDYHSLAVLDRLQAGNMLRTVIAGLDTETRSAIEHAKDSSDLIIKIGASQKSVEAQIEREQYQRYLSVVDRTGVGVPPAYSTQRLVGDFDKLLKRLKIAPKVTNDPLGGLEDVMAGALSNAGFLPEKGVSADYFLETNLQTTELADAKGWNWIRGTLEIIMKRTEDEKVRGSRRWDIKASSQQKEMVPSRAMDEVSKILKRDLRETIIGFGTPQKH